MIPEELENFRPYSDDEIDRLMAEYFERVKQEEKHARQRAEDSLARSLRLRAADTVETGSETQEYTPSPWAQDLKRRLRAAMESKTKPVGGSSTHVGPELVLGSSCTDGISHGGSEPPATCEPSRALPVTALIDSAALVSLVALRETVAPVPGSTASTSSIDRFPVAELGDVPEFDEPGRELAALFRELVLHKDYLAVRTRCCQLSIRMNLRGEVAPAFRDWPRGVALFRSKIGTLITRDQMVIDYHWCHASGMPLSPTDDDHKYLLNLDIAFDFKVAWQLSGKLHKSIYRAGEALCLTPLQQCQTIQLRGREMQERIDRMYKGYLKSGAKSHSELAKATAAIGRWIDNDPRIKQHRVSYLRLWQARELLGPGASKRSIAKLHELMLGAPPLDPKTIADKLTRLSKNVDITLKPASTP